uniref:chlorophyllase n=3 Tax=Mesangiospermae TaxID=1437183 RepID=A1IGR4_SOYBN|nr:Chlorophyllase 3 [Glycine max]
MQNFAESHQLSVMCSSYSSNVNVFDTGKYTAKLLRVESESESYTHNNNVPPPPKSLLIATPLGGGDFPLLLFLHGYLLYNSFYSQLIQHVASHGFIVIAPQLYTVAGPDTSDGIHSAAAITNWLSDGLCKVLPPNVRPNLSKLALAGHSRGGKTAFALTLRKLNITTNLKFSALIGVDPVDGMNKGKQTPPPVLTYVPNSFDFDMAVMVIGSGLGEVKRNPLFPPCAPKGVNHENFFNECKKPAWYFVAKDYGHSDMLDDDTKGIRGKATNCLCKNGESRKPMRRFVGGVIVAFLKAYLHDDNEDLLTIRDRHVSLPVEIKFDSFL